MKCFNCGASVGSEIICPDCGQDLNVQRKALNISDMYYNQGLDKAQIRDMSGAVDLLERSLKFNKRNIRSRNLLGLVYFETGEVVSALSEWVISKNMRPNNNIASEYIEKIQSDQPRLEIIQQTIKRYNRALDACKAGETDVAVIMLKKVISQNPRLMKAYYLLALIYLKNDEFEKARKVLKRTIPVDRTNSAALRFLKEIDERTGTVTDIESIRKGVVNEEARGFWIFKKRRKKERKSEDKYGIDDWDDEKKDAPPSVRHSPLIQLSAFSNLLNILIGIAIGALVTGFIVVPAVKFGINRSADEKIEQFSKTIISQDEQIEKLKTEIEEINEQTDEGSSSLLEAQNQVNSAEDLLSAYMLYVSDERDECKTYLDMIDSSLLSPDSLIVYNEMADDIYSEIFTSAYNNGYRNFQWDEYSESIKYFEKALEVEPENYGALDYIAHSYRLNGQKDEAIEAFGQIIDAYPDTSLSALARKYVSSLQADDFMKDEVGVSEVNSEVESGLEVVEEIGSS